MTNNGANISESDALEARYLRAQTLDQGILTKKVGFNTTIIPHWIDGTDCFWYRRQTKAGLEFRLVDAQTANNEAAFDHAALADALMNVSGQKVLGENLPFYKVTLSLSPKQVNFTAFDKRYVFDCEKNTCKTIEEDTLPAQWLLSPDGKKAVYTRDYNLWLRNLETDEEKALTHDGEQYYYYSQAPMAWGMQLNSIVQALWSPDSRQVLTVQTDNRQVKSSPVIQYVPQDGSLRPIGRDYKSAYPGDVHVEEHRIIAINIETGAVQDANYRCIPSTRSAYGLFSDKLAWWANDSRFSYFVDMKRGDQVARVVEFDTQSDVTRILFEETTETYLSLSPSETTVATLLPLPNSHELIWYSERSGWAHLYLYDLTTGQLKNAITQGEWIVREILHVDTERRELFFQAGGRVTNRDPYYLDICRVNIDTGELTTLIATDHEYTVVASGNSVFELLKGFDPDLAVNTSGVSPSGQYLVATRSRVDQIPISFLLDRDGKQILELDTADVSGLPTGWHWPEPVKLLAADGQTDIYGVVFRPSGFSPDKHYPIIDCSLTSGEFAGVPKGSFTNALLLGLWYLQAAALAELGFIVVSIDGRGTSFRDSAFSQASYGWAPDYNKVEDRIAGIRQLAKQYPYMDLSRVGAMGFNGAVGPVYGLLQHPEFYKVGVVHALRDTRLQATPFGELYEGMTLPTNDKQYAEQLAKNLQGKLLLIHGMLDVMNPPAGTFRLVDALQCANKDFDMLLLPNEGKGSHISSSYAFRRTWDYFVKHLQGAEPPKEYKLTNYIDLRMANKA